MNKYSHFEDLGKAFNPSLVPRMAKNVDAIYLSDTPTIGLVGDTYGRACAIKWIEIQINSVDLFTQVKNDLEEDQRKELSEHIYSQYHFLKLPEFMLFIARFKVGIYGHFYASFDPIKFCEALKKFRIDRNAELERIRINTMQQEVEKRRFAPPKGYSSLTWYQELMKRAENGDEEAIAALQRP